MLSYSKVGTNILSLFISIIFFSLFLISWEKLENNMKKISFNSIFNADKVEVPIEQENSIINEIHEEVEKKQVIEEVEKPSWRIEIPSLFLVAEIQEGTTKEVMDKFVGHFEETVRRDGNVGFAAHNRGYPVNYFENLKLIQKGAIIEYYYEDFHKTYEVQTIEIIKNTDWSYLEKTDDNRITLITCVENEPEYRRCVQGIEKIESEEKN